MKFSSFLSKLFAHVVLWAALLYAFSHKAVGIENALVFVIGFSAFSVFVSTLLNGGLSSIDVPGSRLGRAAFLLFHYSRWLLVFTLAAHSHFVSAFVLAISASMIYSAYASIRQVERQIRDMLKSVAQSIEEYDEQVNEDLGYAAGRADVAESPKTTSAQVKVNPNAARDPAFGYPFSSKDIAASA
jgi:hypothetical protein